MRVIPASAYIMDPMTKPEIDLKMMLIEQAARTCYKSEGNIIPGVSAEKIIRMLIRNHHEAMLEHATMTVRFIVDRGVSHEIVRHRIASFAQESTRYCNYGNEKFGRTITVINPNIPCDEKWTDKFFDTWNKAMKCADECYQQMIRDGVPPEWARSVLPNSLKTEVIVTMNMREWRHFFKLRALGTTGKPHPQMQEVALPLLEHCKVLMPAIFGDLVKGE